MKKTVAKRIKITKTGKLMRRKMAQCHFRANKTGQAIRGKRGTMEIHASDLRGFSQKLKG